ncbi:hypothetical protein CYMTET_25352 [Cymbomonas tetramitiformis]|uniref:Uncharacterized protein n=1 Tax=Cymbomonas tetramitiformis TaxID=36881 RepID=A0AAE0KZB6_9CHLO|nr:hypothetical protein CYMTET_25352 [Cymbomonas tetramitiformis]
MGFFGPLRLPELEEYAGRRLALQSTGVFHAESFILNALRTWFSSGCRLLDYEIHQLVLTHNPVPHMFVLVACVMRLPARNTSDANKQPMPIEISESSAVLAAPLRLLGLLVEVQIPSGRARLVRTMELRKPATAPPAGVSQSTNQGVQSASTLLEGVPAFVRSLQARYQVPHSHASQPMVLTNATVLDVGISVQAIKHPVLPIAILGYGMGNTANRRKA